MKNEPFLPILTRFESKKSTKSRRNRVSFHSKYESCAVPARNDNINESRNESAIMTK